MATWHRALFLLLPLLLELTHARGLDVSGNPTSPGQRPSPSAQNSSIEHTDLPGLSQQTQLFHAVLGHDSQPFWVIVVGQLLGSVIRVRSDMWYAHAGQCPLWRELT